MGKRVKTNEKRVCGKAVKVKSGYVVNDVIAFQVNTNCNSK